MVAAPVLRLTTVVALALVASACAAGRERQTLRPSGAASARGATSPPARPRADGDMAPGPMARARPPEPIGPAGPPTLRDDDGPLTAKIDTTTPPRRAAALRLTEQARGVLAGGDAPRAIEILERAVAVDARTPYAYYFLAEAHARAEHRVLARSFAARAEQLFAADPYWLGRSRALHGRIAEDDGRADEARDAYTRALAVWPRNGDAATGLARLDARGQGAQ